MSNQKTIGVDIGNSSIKTAAFFSSELGDIRKWKKLDQIVSEYPDSHFVVSSVGIDEGTIKNTFSECLIVNTNLPLPILLNYDTPESLGSDRIAAAVGAWKQFPNTNILIVDAGTCITYDFVSAKGVFEGGIISPGLEMRLQSMHQFTNKLPLVNSNFHYSVDNLMGKSTKECIWIGAKEGLNFEIEGILKSFNKKHDHLQVVFTGGSVLNFESISKAHIFASSKIVLSGLHAIWKFNEAN